MWLSLKCGLDLCVSFTLIDTHILSVKGTVWPLYDSKPQNWSSSVLRLIEPSLLFSAVAFLLLRTWLRECLEVHVKGRIISGIHHFDLHMTSSEESITEEQCCEVMSYGKTSKPLSFQHYLNRKKEKEMSSQPTAFISSKVFNTYLYYLNSFQ